MGVAGKGCQGPRERISGRETDGRVMRCPTCKGGGQKETVSISITSMINSKNGGFNCWKVLGAKIIKLKKKKKRL